MGSLGLEVKDILCLQENPRENGYDVTLHTLNKCAKVSMDWWKRQDEEKLKDFEIVNLGIREVKTIIVHMYDPHVSKEAILKFLSKYLTTKYAGDRMLLDEMGIWTGKREFFGVTLKDDPGGYQGLAHPPAFFNIGACRGYLVYAGQPPFCKKCRVSGHRSGNCTETPAPKACHSCRSTDHLVKDCPGRGKAGGGRPGGGVDETGAAGPSTSVGGGGRKDTKEKEASPKASAGSKGQKGGARTGSQAFNGNGAPSTDPGKKVRTEEETVEVMDLLPCEGVGTLAGLEGRDLAVLGYDSGQPSCLFAPLSPLPNVGTLSAMAEEGEEGSPEEQDKGGMDLYD